MTDQYSGDMLVGLMDNVSHSLTRKPDDNRDIPEPKAEVGGVIVEVGGLKVHAGPEVIESFRRIKACKGQWQTENPVIKAVMRAVAREAGFPGVFD